MVSTLEIIPRVVTSICLEDVLAGNMSGAFCISPRRDMSRPISNAMLQHNDTIRDAKRRSRELISRINQNASGAPNAQSLNCNPTCYLQQPHVDLQGLCRLVVLEVHDVELTSKRLRETSARSDRVFPMDPGHVSFNHYPIVALDLCTTSARSDRVFPMDPGRVSFNHYPIVALDRGLGFRL